MNQSDERCPDQAPADAHDEHHAQQSPPRGDECLYPQSTLPHAEPVAARALIQALPITTVSAGQLVSRLAFSTCQLKLAANRH